MADDCIRFSRGMASRKFPLISFRGRNGSNKRYTNVPRYMATSHGPKGGGGIHLSRLVTLSVRVAHVILSLAVAHLLAHDWPKKKNYFKSAVRCEYRADSNTGIPFREFNVPVHRTPVSRFPLSNRFTQNPENKL